MTATAEPEVDLDLPALPTRRDEFADARRRRIVALSVFAILAAALGLRLWHLEDRPGLEYDEPVYASVAHNLRVDGRLQVREPIDVDESYLYHPPFYFAALSVADRVDASPVLIARVIAAIGGVLALALMWLLLREWPGGAAAVVVLGLLALEGWIMYTNRVGWIENAGLPIMLLGLVLYTRARAGHAFLGSVPRAYSAAGWALGCAAIFKLTLFVGILAVVIHWLIMRDEYDGHVRALRGAMRLIFFYFATMTLIYGREFLRQVAVQFNRSTGRYSSRGVVHIGDVISAFTHNYAAFVGTLAFLVVAIVLLGSQLVRAARRRSMEALRDESSFAIAWSLAALAFVGLLSLKYPQYMVLVLIPLMFYAGGRAAMWVCARPSGPRRWVVVGGVVLMLFGDAAAYASVALTPRVDAIAGATAYLATLPHSQLVLADEPIGASIPQPYLNIDRWVFVRTQPTPSLIAAITTKTQRLPDSPKLRRLLATSRVLRRFHGFKGDVTVYETCVRGPCSPRPAKATGS